MTNTTATRKIGQNKGKPRPWIEGPVLEQAKLQPTGTLDGTTARNSVHFASPGEDRATERSRFFPGMARAMAEQWGGYAAETMKLAA